MTMLPRLLFVLLLIAAPVVIWATSARLPARVATHFGGGGFANGWMTHDGYLMFILAFAVLLPLVVVAIMIATRAHVLHRDLAPQRRAATLSGWVSHACWLGCLLVVFVTAVHFLTLAANAVTPARLPEPAFFTVLAVFVIAVLLWALALRARFRT